MVCVASRTGLNHEICEDGVLVGEEIISGSSATLPMPETGFVCVADGVGGNKGGAHASHFILEALADLDEGEDLFTSLERINSDLIKKAEETPEAYNMASTLTGVYHSSDCDQLIHVGNTRAYIRQGKYLKQITSDHTTYNWLRCSGQIEAAEMCNKNEITNCFGGAKEEYLSKLIVDVLPPFSLMVLTSDGVHEHVDLDTLEDMLSGEGEYIDKCEAILDEAIINGSEDDMTIVVIDAER